MSKTALITGAANGIGYEIAKRCSEDNYDLVLVDQNEDKLSLVQKELIETYKVNVRIIPLNLANNNAADVVYSKIKDVSIDVLVNNAGFGLVGMFHETDWSKEHDMLQLHVVTFSKLTKLIVKTMIPRKRGKILNVASLAAFYPGPLMSVYYATKAYILSFSEAIANELKDTGITVTVLCPGFVWTDFQKTAGSHQFIISRLKFLSSPEEISKYGYKAMLKGKLIAIPGFLSKMIFCLQKIIPRILVTNLVGLLQKKNQHV